jgi:hypothetical protein
MFKAENKNAVLKIPHLDQFSENFVSHSVFGDKFGKIAFPWENFVGTFGVCECKSETCLDRSPDVPLITTSPCHFIFFRVYRHFYEKPVYTSNFLKFHTYFIIF